LYVVLIPALAAGWSLDSIGIHEFAATGVYFGRWPYRLSSLLYDVSERMSATIALSNAANMQTILTPTLGSNGPLWSLANEYWYYILFPLLLLPFVAGQSRSARVAWAACAVALGALLYPEILEYGSIWLLGALIRLCPRIPLPPTWMTGVLVVGAALLHVALGNALAFKFPFPLDLGLALVFVTFVHGAVHAKRTDPLPGGKLHAELAGFSYSLYLLHFPFVLLVSVWLQSRWGVGLSQLPHGWRPFLLMAALLVAANLYAWLFSLATERHTASVRKFLTQLLFSGTSAQRTSALTGPFRFGPLRRDS
jgi:peptidoglycan/LPS O-acetylase OafA/YrhL